MAISFLRVFLLAFLVPLLAFCLIYRLEFQTTLSTLSLSHLPSTSFLDSKQGNAASKQTSEATPFTRHIVAVGDLHGDMPNAERVLRFAGVVDDFGEWSGDVDFFVQTGDIIDR